MEVRIHRGAAEIGGNCIEVRAQNGERLVLDVGRPLSAGLLRAPSRSRRRPDLAFAG